MKIELPENVRRISYKSYRRTLTALAKDVHVAGEDIVPHNIREIEAAESELQLRMTDPSLDRILASEVHRYRFLVAEPLVRADRRPDT
ncbi:MAG: hypothetical protein FWD92_06290 [Methanomassiliicoccaceae archaeon]|nr:hypothetical protein [Methanomassiliicoccaceae archaeon]